MPYWLSYFYRPNKENLLNKVEDIIQSIEQSKEANNYFAMLTSSLVLIDICSSIEYRGQDKASCNRLSVLDKPIPITRR